MGISDKSSWYKKKGGVLQKYIFYQINHLTMQEERKVVFNFLAVLKVFHELKEEKVITSYNPSQKKKLRPVYEIE